ncbi:hypothetical protein DPMN_089445 [Dreissena polymorpha]|uniref:Uncharacterized protein n=1 Tax=Dreissena polymorpha TaxID=45954 RepID=A0A9D4KVZ4_DREPO|nr:hypothetical protein DPMN_089445 [Dreissena polymorpha]
MNISPSNAVSGCKDPVFVDDRPATEELLVNHSVQGKSAKAMRSDQRRLHRQSVTPTV